MGEKATVAVRRIDEPFRVPHLAAAMGEADTRNTVLWIRPPVTEEEAAARNRDVDEAIEQALANPDKRSAQNAANLMRRQRAEACEGTPYTVRTTALRAMYAQAYPMAAKNPKDGTAIPDTEEDRAAMHYIGAAFQKAKPGGGVLLTKRQVALLKRKAYELGQYLNPAAYGLFVEALDYAMGPTEHQAQVVEVLEPEPDLDAQP